MSDSASTAASVATLLKLPNELLSLILARPELDYLDLKCFSRVCRRFHAVEQDTSLDYKLFRQGPAQRQVGKGCNVDFHPILDALLMTDASLDKGMAYLSPKLQKIGGVPTIAGGLDWGNGEAGKEGKDGDWDEDDGFLETLDTIPFPCASEYATSPASRHLKLQVFDDFTLDNSHGVTVGNVVVAVIERWAWGEAPAVSYLWELLGKNAWEEQMVWRCGSIEARQALRKKALWRGVHTLVALDDGVAKLVAKWGQ
ncbi:hypothetical protein JCM5296_000092 [Sporobolomyces johnsonii]